MIRQVDKVPRIRELTDDDVLLGRGFPAIENEGNVRFRELVRSRSAEYHAAYRRHTKDSIARDVVNTILRRKGRFLTQLDSVPDLEGLVLPAGSRVWADADEAAVLIKAKQALRDHSDSSKEARVNARRRPAAGSGNVVLEWVTPSPSPAQAAQAAPHASTSSAAMASTASATSVAAAAPIPSTSLGIPTTSIQQQTLMANLIAARPQQLICINQEMRGFGSLSPGANQIVQPAASTNVTAQLNPHGSATLQSAIQQYLSSQGDAAAPTSAFGGSTENPLPALAALQRLLASQTSAPVSDPGRSSSSGSLGSSQQQQHSAGKLSTSAIQQAITGGSRALMSLNRGVDKASTSAASTSGASAVSSDTLRLCALELSLLKVLCSLGLPLWQRETRDRAFAGTQTASVRDEGSLVLTWGDIGSHLLFECQSSASAVTAAETLSKDPQELAKVVVFLVRRCVECSKGVTKPAAPSRTSGTSSRFREGRTGATAKSSYFTEGDTAVVEQALTQWSLEVGDCSALDGSFVTGTILETMEWSLEAVTLSTTNTRKGEEKRASSSSSFPSVAAILGVSDCRTVVETLATLLQLRWIFQYHPTKTIFSLLVQQQQQQGSDTTSREYLVLKGVLAHGLANELEFRIQQLQQQGATTMTRNEVEDRICLLTKLLFKHLQNQEKKESLASLQSSYNVLLFGK